VEIKVVETFTCPACGGGTIIKGNKIPEFELPPDWIPVVTIIFLWDLGEFLLEKGCHVFYFELIIFFYLGY